MAKKKRPLLIGAAKLVPVDVSYRIVTQGKNISAIRSVVDKWGGRRLAIIEHNTNSVPTRMDPRSPKIKHFIAVWKWSNRTRAGYFVARQMEISVFRKYLVEKLDQLWPMHWAAKELSHPVLHLKLLSNHKPSDMRWLVNVINKLMPRSQEWLSKRGYIQRGEDNRFSLTEAGHEHFVKKRGTKPAANARNGILRRRRTNISK